MISGGLSQALYTYPILPISEQNKKERDPFGILENQIPETILTDALYHSVYSTIRLTS